MKLPFRAMVSATVSQDAAIKVINYCCHDDRYEECHALVWRVNEVFRPDFRRPQAEGGPMMAVSDHFTGPYAGPGLPRAQAGPQPQYLLLMLLADYWRTKEPLPSQALVRLLADFDVTEASARAAIGRLTRRGRLELTRDGRRTCYRLTENADTELAAGLRRT